MALRYLAGKLSFPAGAALRRVQGSRGVASHAHQVGYAKEGIAASMGRPISRRRRTEGTVSRQASPTPNRLRYDTRLVLCFSGGTILGVFIVSLMLRYENRSGGKIGKFMCGIPSE